MQTRAQIVFLSESRKLHLRERSLDVASRILRFSGRYAAARRLDRVDADACGVRPGSGVSRVDALVINEGAMERSLRRGFLQFAARKLRLVAEEEGVGEFSEAADFLESVARDDSPGSFVQGGMITSVPRSGSRSRIPEAAEAADVFSSPDDEPRAFGDEDEDDGREHTAFFPRLRVRVGRQIVSG